MIIWIASYPRSGNTFLRVILKSVFGLETYSIYDDKSAIAKDAATTEIVGHRMLPDNFDLDDARISQRLYLVKTHDVVCNSDDKAIYLVRDGRQSALSYMKYINSFLNRECGIRDVLYGNVPFGSWGRSIEEWNPKHRPNTLLLKFEDLTAAPHAYLDQISQFIGVEKESEEIPGFEDLHSINPKFFRQGKSDSWKDELTQDHINVFWMNNFIQMQEYYPQEKFPSLFQDTHKTSQFSKLFSEQGTYFQKIVTDLRLQVGDKERKINILEENLCETSDRLERIRSTITEMINMKAWKSPLQKYQIYKKLLDVFFSTAN